MNMTRFDDEVLWAMPPYFRKTARNRRSEGFHLVPLVGFAADAAATLWNMSDDWLMPAAFHKRKSGARAKSDHMDVRSLSRVLELMPDVTSATHIFRRAAASYGPPELGWHERDSKLILDHMEGHDGGDVTAQHYNSDPALLKKRAMMQQWIGWLQEAAAVAADPMLLDRDAIAELVYRKRYGIEEWQAALAKSKNGKLPWIEAA
jgi:hypothetical protein